MKYLKLFENFSEDEIQYFVNRVGDSFRIFALTPKMKSDGLDYNDAVDAEEVFGDGSLWVDYPSYEDAKKVIDSLKESDSSWIFPEGYEDDGDDIN